jgi:hypothetical protein
MLVHPARKLRKEGINSFFSQVLQQSTSKLFLLLSPTAKVFGKGGLGEKLFSKKVFPPITIKTPCL